MLAEGLIYAIVFASSLAILCIYFLEKDFYRSMNLESKIFSAINQYGFEIATGLACTVGVVVPTLVEIVLDLFVDQFHSTSGIREQLAMIMGIIFPSLAEIFYLSSKDAPYMFICMHIMQLIIFFGSILSICNKAAPVHFTTRNSIMVFAPLCVSGIFFIHAYSSNLIYWENILALIFFFIGFFSFARCINSYLKTFEFSTTFSFMSTLRNLPENDIICVAYLTSTIVAIFLVPGIAGTWYLFRWENFDQKVVLVYIFSYLFFALIPTCIPNRVDKFKYIMMKRDSLAAQVSKRATLRYLSHELRSPLNVVCNGVKYVMEDMETGSNSHEIVESLKNVAHSSASAIHLLDDFLNFEKIESGILNICPMFVAVPDIVEAMIKPLRVFSRQKDIHFSYSVSVAEGYAETQVGSSVDKYKMEQVLRNLFVNAVKFTPSGGTITVAIRQEIVTKLGLRKFSNCTAKDSMELASPRGSVKPVQRGSATFRFDFGADGRGGGFGLGRRGSSVTPLVVDGPCSPAANGALGEVVGDLVVEVTDTGVGIPEEARPRIFGQFFQLEPEKLQGGGGSGLGLWISKEIVERHGGALTFYPGPNNIGTTFSVRLPCVVMDRDAICTARQLTDAVPTVHLVARADRAGKACTLPEDEKKGEEGAVCVRPPGTTSDERPLVAISSSLAMQGIGRYCVGVDKDIDMAQDSATPRHLRVLVVDDSPMNRKVTMKCFARVVSKVFKDCSYELHEADDGDVAVEAVKRAADMCHAYDIVFLDNFMLKLNGPEAAQQMRSFGFAGHIIGVTGNVFEDDINAFLRCGVDAVLKKPLEEEDLIRVVERALGAGHV